ncbi:hypothetical protein LCA32G_1243 [Lacticaseibacillus paracasei]|nr:hypothetical protein LCA32G_1243 [Lacticaseibacillus paracasei]
MFEVKEGIAMKALYKGNPVDVWEINKTGARPDWVKEAFDENYLYWLDDHLRILMSGLNPSLATNLKIGAVGKIGGGFSGYGMYAIGYPSDFLDVTNHRVVSKKKFLKHYQVQEP